MTQDQIAELFSKCVAALNYRALRFEVRERPFALLLAVESFGRGQEFGVLDVRGWRAILCENDDKSIWRLAELHRLLKVFVVKGWLVVDAGAGTYRLRPDQWPCWAHVCALIGRQDRSRLDFVPDVDLNAMLALLSQQGALDGHGLAGTDTAKVSHPLSGTDAANNSQTAKVSQVRIAPIGQPPDPEPPPKPPEKPGDSSGSFESVSKSFVRSSENFSQSARGLDPSNPNRTHDHIRNSIRSNGASRDEALRQGPIRADAPKARGTGFGRRSSTALPAPMTVVTLCTLDGYIAEKLRSHPKGERLRRELAGQSTYTAQAFQRHFERSPDRAREDVGWFLEANNPNARMNTHMATALRPQERKHE